MIGTGKKLLTIDDEEGLRQSIRDYFEDYDFEVYDAENGEKGIDLFRKILPDVVLIDLRMKGLNGLEVVRILHGEAPEIPLIVVSGTGIIEDAIAAIREGAWDYVAKPIMDMLALSHTIERAFEKAALIKENKRYQNQLEILVKDRTIELQNANQELYNLNRKLQDIVETTCALQGFDRIDAFGKFLLENFGKHLNASGGSIYLCENEGLRLIHSLESAVVPGFIKYPLEERSILKRALRTGEPQITESDENKHLLEILGISMYKEGSSLVFPLTDSNRKNVGLLTLHIERKPHFTEQDKEIGSILSSFSSEAIRAINFTEDIQKRAQLFRILAKGIGGSTDQELLNSIVTSCVSIFETEYALLGRLEDGKIHTEAYIENGKFDSLCFDIAGTPAETVLKEGSKLYSGNLKELFPEDKILCDIEIESYIGSAIINSKGKTIGVLCTFSKYPITFPDYWSEILELMTSRYSSLVDRVKADNVQAQLRGNLQQAQKMEAIGTLAGGIAHDFNNILSPILGYSEMILYSISEDDKFKNDIEQIKHAGVRAKELVQQILSFSRQKEIKAKPIEIQIIGREVVRMLKSTLPATIKIEQNIKNDCLPVEADPTQIHQVIMNLCTNSFHAMEEKGGILTIVVENTEVVNEHFEATKFVKIFIKDTGSGIDQEVIDRIYEPYFTTKKEGKGTGLGLSVAHGIVSSFNGFINIESEKNVGSSFTVYLPVVEKHQVETKEEEKEIEQGSENIMIIDDQIPILKVTGNVLKEIGYNITSFSDPLSAYKAFEEDPDKYDLIITDQTMPDLTGDKLAEKIFKIRKDFPIILCTGYSSIITKQKAGKLGIKAFMLKPLEMNELASTIRKLLDS
ncbi:MAG: response regulator [Deltaproteobacteria bacterium]|nr:response regulator [Deltaproteobacteria bacterium]